MTTEEPAGFVTEVAPATVKKFAGNPAAVNPGFGVSKTVAVSTVDGAKFVGESDQEMNPVNCASLTIEALGTAPFVGGVIPEIVELEMVEIFVPKFHVQKFHKKDALF